MWLSKYWLGFPLSLLLIGVATSSEPVIGISVLLLLATGIAKVWSSHALDNVRYERIIPENRAFPGERRGTVSQLIAHYVSTLILPLCDVVMDFHAGGRTMTYQPFACIHRLDDKGLFDRTKAALLALGAPISLILQELDAEGMLDTQVEGMGKVFVGAELGGAGTTTPTSRERPVRSEEAMTSRR